MRLRYTPRENLSAIVRVELADGGCGAKKCSHVLRHLLAYDFGDHGCKSFEEKDDLAKVGYFAVHVEERAGLRKQRGRRHQLTP